KSFSMNIFYVVAAVGIVVTWMDKSTKIFQIPSNEATFGNPVFSIIIPDFFKHKFNTNTLPVFLFNSNPVMAVYAWPLLFIAGFIALVNNNLRLDNSGIFGAWKYYDLAGKYRNAAQNTQEPNQKRRLYSDAANAYRKVIQYFPNDPDCNFYMGTCYFYEGYPDSAIVFYKKALILKPQFPEASRDLGLI